MGRLTSRDRLLLNLAALVLLSTATALAAVVLSTEHLVSLGGLAVFTFFVMGKFVVLLPVLSTDVPFTPYFLAGTVTVMDVATGLVVAANLGQLYRLPWVGRQLSHFEAGGRETLERRPWMRRLATAGVVLFVMFPLTGTGAVGGTLFGRLIGLNAPRVLLGISAGAVAGAYGLAFAAHSLGAVLDEWRHTWWFKAAGYGVILLVVGLLVAGALRSRRRGGEVETSGPPPEF